jgi:hypothetical protein
VSGFLCPFDAKATGQNRPGQASSHTEKQMMRRQRFFIEDFDIEFTDDGGKNVELVYDASGKPRVSGHHYNACVGWLNRLPALA